MAHIHGMNIDCPQCSADRTYIVDSYWSTVHSAKMRRRKCQVCNTHFNTKEEIVPGSVRKFGSPRRRDGKEAVNVKSKS